MAVSIGAINSPTATEKANFFKKVKQMLLPSEPEQPLPKVRLHEFTARGWNVTMKEWKEPIYAALTESFQVPNREHRQALEVMVGDFT
jgi:hypothetical protein